MSKILSNSITILLESKKKVQESSGSEDEDSKPEIKSEPESKKKTGKKGLYI
mgnify:CR=1 FL=1